MIKTFLLPTLFLAPMSTFSSIAVAIKDSTHAVKTLEIYKTIIEIPTVAGRGKVPEMAAYLASEFRKVGFTDEDIQIIPKGETVGMIVRYKGDSIAGNKPILLLGHMDVVEALDKDWERPPLRSLKMISIFKGVAPLTINSVSPCSRRRLYV
jgi:carboxypeptidase PM20D1